MPGNLRKSEDYSQNISEEGMSVFSNNNIDYGMIKLTGWKNKYEFRKTDENGTVRFTNRMFK